MARTLAVVINREGVHNIEAVTPGFEAADDFDIELKNEGQATHVHLHLDDELATVARLGGSNNQFVEAGKSVRVPVEMDGVDDPLTGRMKVVTGYGAETSYVDISLVPEEEPRETVTVDEQLSVKQPREEPAGRSISSITVGIVLLALLAVLVVAGALLLTDDPVVVGASVIVILAVVGGLYYSMR